MLAPSEHSLAGGVSLCLSHWWCGLDLSPGWWHLGVHLGLDGFKSVLGGGEDQRWGRRAGPPLLCSVVPDCTWWWHHHPASNPAEFGRRAFRWCWAGACTCKDCYPWAAERAPKFPCTQPGCTGPGYESACQRHAYVRDAAMAHTSPPPAVFDIRIMPYSSLQRDQLHLCCALPGLGQRRRGSLPVEGRHTPSPAPE